MGRGAAGGRARWAGRELAAARAPHRRPAGRQAGGAMARRQPRRARHSSRPRAAAPCRPPHLHHAVPVVLRLGGQGRAQGRQGGQAEAAADPAGAAAGAELVVRARTGTQAGAAGAGRCWRWRVATSQWEPPRLTGLPAGQGRAGRSMRVRSRLWQPAAHSRLCITARRGPAPHHALPAGGRRRRHACSLEGSSGARPCSPAHHLRTPQRQGKSCSAHP